jgi:hypothetical protein
MPRIRRENRQYSNFCVVNDPAETVSAGSLSTLNRFGGSLTPLKSVLKNHYHALFQ